MKSRSEMDAEEQSPREQMLRHAIDLVTSDRNIDYGEPFENMSRIAEMMAAYMGKRTGREMDATDPVAFGIILKLSRLANNPRHLDSWTDLAGYASIGFEVVKKGDQLAASLDADDDVVDF